MFENYHPVHFLARYLDTSVFSPPIQAQFPTHIPRAISNSYSLAATVRFCSAVAISWSLKFDRELIH